MRVLAGFTQRSGGRAYTVLYDLSESDDRATGRMAAHIAKTGDGLAKKTAEVAAKLILEQFPVAAAVEVKAGSLVTKVVR
jgi:hypothetical protein